MNTFITKLMAKMTVDEKIGQYEADNLIMGTCPPCRTGGGYLVPGTGDLARGTVLAACASGALPARRDGSRWSIKMADSQIARRAEGMKWTEAGRKKWDYADNVFLLSLIKLSQQTKENKYTRVADDVPRIKAFTCWQVAIPSIRFTLELTTPTWLGRIGGIVAA